MDACAAYLNFASARPEVSDVAKASGVSAERSHATGCCKQFWVLPAAASG